MPFESRWEALEELETVCGSKARLLKQGENIALYFMGDLEIVRVGKAELHEEAWWRYGYAFLTRAERIRSITRRGKIAHAVLMAAITGIPFWGLYDPEASIERARDKRFGSILWSGMNHCEKCGKVLSKLRFEKFTNLVLVEGVNELDVLRVCSHCSSPSAQYGHRWSGVAAQHLLRRGFAFTNFAGAGKEEIASAMKVIDDYGSPGAMLGRLGKAQVSIAQLSPAGAMGAEIALNSQDEARRLKMEVEALQERWREEEVLAAIMDQELTPGPRSKIMGAREGG